ncbi:MAG: hypothetical protein KDA20_04080 [Phycisphaerales bacterium]|nr:hypothetical protein [Phycisphaerales bacterium]
MRRHVTSRRGFTFVLVLVVTIIATAMISWQLRRMHLRAVAVQMQVDSYAEHHQLLGVRDVVWNWARRRSRTDKTMADLVREPGPHYEAQLPGEFLIRVWVHDGQGTILANLKGADTDRRRDLMMELLRRVPLDRPDLTRRGGPMEMSITAMPDVVIDAICGGDQQLASAMRYIRDDTSKEGKRDMRTEFIAQGFDPNDIADIFALLTFTPVLWQLEVEAVRATADGTPGTPERYALLVEIGTDTKLHEWRPAQDPPLGSTR